MIGLLYNETLLLLASRLVVYALGGITLDSEHNIADKHYCASIVHTHVTTNRAHARGTVDMQPTTSITKAKQTSPKPTSEHLMLTSPSSHRASNM